MNAHQKRASSPAALFTSVWRNRQLIAQLARREVIGRYRGSVMGLAWSFLNPLLMLAVYTLFFTVAFNARWGSEGALHNTDFAIVLFVGLIIHGFFAECLSRSPGLIITNTNYVKKVVFPLEILSVVTVISALFHASISLIVLLIGQLALNGSLSWTCIFFPLLIAPFVLLVLGGSWLLSSTGVYLRDIGHMIGMLMSVMLFLSPVFYPVSSLPAKIQPWIILNPLTFIIEQSRAVLLNAQQPDWQGLGLYYAISLTIAWVGFWWFQRLRKGFADVL